MSGSDRDPHLQMRQRALIASLHGRSVTVLHQDADGRFDLAENLPAVWPRRDMIGLEVADVLPEPLAGGFAAAGNLVRADGTDQLLEFELADDHRRRSFEARFINDEDGLIVIITDVTDERGRDAAVASLLREVSHRSKNMLAIVQSVAMQTAHHSDGVQDFLDKFRGRLHALSSTQDLVTESNWRGTYLQSLVTSQLTRVGHGALAHMRITGANPLLSPNASLHIGLAIHELAANAVLHGALSDGQTGAIWIDAHIVTRPGQLPDLVIEWQESGVAPGSEPLEPRFGSLVLERIVPLSVGGSADFEIVDDRVHYRLSVPGDQFEI